MSAPKYRLSELCEHYAPYYGVEAKTLRNWCQFRRYSLKGMYTKADARRRIFSPWAAERRKAFKTKRG